MDKQPGPSDRVHDGMTTEEQDDRRPNGDADNRPAPSASASQPEPGAGFEGFEDKGSLSAFWETVKRLPRYLRLINAMARDERIPRRSKGALIAGGAYLVSPIDLVPGVIPVAGQVDDLYVLLTALRQAIRMAPDEVVDEHLAATETSRDEIDADLDNLRSLVRQGVAWLVRNGGRAVASLGRSLSTFVNKQRQKGG